MNRRSPPWGAIEAFVTVARHASFKVAADDLGLSAPAVSRRVQALESHVGARLFDRAASATTLTPAGRRYLARLAPGYEAVRAATERMRPVAERRPLRVAVSQSLAISWLLPRLHRLQAQGIVLALHTRQGSVDLAGGMADVALLHGDGQWPGLQAQALFPLQAGVVCAPALAAGLPPAPSGQVLAGHRLLEAMRPPRLWSTWSALAGVPLDPDQPRQRFDSVQVLHEAAARGLGLAVGLRPLVAPCLAEGRLVSAWPGTVTLPGAVHIVALPALRRDASVRRFWQWAVQEAAAGEP